MLVRVTEGFCVPNKDLLAQRMILALDLMNSAWGDAETSRELGLIELRMFSESDQDLGQDERHAVHL